MYHKVGYALSPMKLSYARTAVGALTLAPGPGGACIVSGEGRFDKIVLDLAWTAVEIRVVGLHPTQQIPAHRDASIAPLVRYHLPLYANPGCWSFSAGVWQQLEVGHFYQMDPAEEHGAVNWGATLRVHLMIDVDHAR